MKVTAEPNELDKMIILTSKKKFTYTVKKRNVQVSSRLVIFTNEVCYEIVDQCTWKRLDFFPFLMSIINGFSGNLSLGPKDLMWHHFRGESIEKGCTKGWCPLSWIYLEAEQQPEIIPLEQIQWIISERTLKYPWRQIMWMGVAFGLNPSLMSALAQPNRCDQ